MSLCVKVVLTLLVLTECRTVDAHAIDLAEMEIKLNTILDSEVAETDLLRKLYAAGPQAAQKEGRRRESVGILEELAETSGRMEWLVGLLADLKTLLHQAVVSQQKQLSLRSEVVELREEIKYLR